MEGAKDLMALVKTAKGSDGIVFVLADHVTRRDTVSFQTTSSLSDKNKSVKLMLKENKGKTHSVHSSSSSGSERFRGVFLHADTLTMAEGQVRLFYFQ